MKRLFLVLAVIAFPFIAFATATPTLDPSPGTVVGQKTYVVNPLQEPVIVSGTTSIKLNAPVTLAIGQKLELVWDGVYWVGLGFRPGKASFDYDFPNVPVGTCATSPDQTVVGALSGDGCAPGTTIVALREDVGLNCLITGAAIGRLQVCARVPADGGTGGADLGDAGFTLRAIK